MNTDVSFYYVEKQKRLRKKECQFTNENTDHRQKKYDVSLIRRYSFVR